MTSFYSAKRSAIEDAVKKAEKVRKELFKKESLNFHEERQLADAQKTVEMGLQLLGFKPGEIIDIERAFK